MNMNTQTKSYYGELVSPYSDIFKVSCPNVVTEDQAEKRAEEHMKTLINDADKMEEMDFEPLHIRLVSTHNKTMNRKANRTFVVSLRDEDGNFGGKRGIHRFDEHGTLHTHGVRERLGYKNIAYEWYDARMPYKQAPTKPPPMKPRQEERVKVDKDDSMFHPGKAPSDGQVQYTFSHSNEFSRSLKKINLLTDATTFKATPEAKKNIKLHCSATNIKFLRVITESEDGTITLHYFKCTQHGEHNHWHVYINEDTILKNWAPKKHMPKILAYLNSE
jgi:hypothetical protein